MERTPLYDWHVANGARMVDFAGWSMPVQYTSIVAEHTATRAACGMADISHMGRLRFEGPGAEEFLAGLLTRRVGDLRPGQIRYSLVTNEQGGILDDVLVGYYHDEFGQPFLPSSWSTLPIAGRSSHGLKAICRDRAPRCAAKEVIWSDVTRLWAMFAIQGPRSVEFAPADSRRRLGMDALLQRSASENFAPRCPTGKEASSAAPDTPGRMASSLASARESPGRFGRCFWNWASRWESCRPGSALATRSAWKPACPCTTTN